ncbi:MAG: D-alanyl-D-alanine carboxypeptidase family protein, partial [Candidatus Binatia bacterium]
MIVRVLLKGFLLVTAILLFCGSVPAASPAPKSPVPKPPPLKVRNSILLDHYSGRVLAEVNAGERAEPASLTKLMTAYVLFQELGAGRMQVTDQAIVSEKAWRMSGSRTFLKVGTQVTLEDLLKGMIIQSGNDASVALAEHVAGSEEAFAELMNRAAQKLGLSGTHFVNSTGLPDPEHYITAKDIALLMRAIIREFPQYYEWYSQREFTYNGIT